MSSKSKRAALSEAILDIATRTLPGDGDSKTARQAEGEAQGKVPERSAQTSMGTQPPGGGIVRRALEVHREGLVEKIARLERELGQTEGGMRLAELDTATIREVLPTDRHPRAFADPAFRTLRESIARNGQQTPIVVRPAKDGRADSYEIAAGRRRLAACRELGRPVLARIMPLADDEMLGLQYRENAERADISLFERGRWLARLSSERSLSTRRLAELFDLSQASIVEYLKLGRLPDALVDVLADPRELTIDQSRRLHAALAGGEPPSALLDALETARARGTAQQISFALQAVAGRPATARESGRSLIRDRAGRRLATLTRSGNQWVLRWAAGLDDDAVRAIAQRLPDLFEAWERSNGRSKSAKGE
ncbi:chromosome partitioning protein, ParB family [Arboricoccus pini]|uniref:Chromosome partitioning protein, ParB family n=1 Tax=Arboricoccus pini TaxID=1963835 RepID=A0A212RI52_9PROT|nr:ParB/RepB/Spo0J family partition protein [Arboricoccus pini]SNB72068.1 chromosome partitioning protein, ParB family [Arboricoccus pini]